MCWQGRAGCCKTGSHAELHELLQTRPSSIWVHKSSLAAPHPSQLFALTECAGACAASQGDVIPERELRRLLSEVDLEYLVEREGGLDAVVDWGAQLSLGEQQRLGMARLFYHRPKFAILDECTSGVTVRPFVPAVLPERMQPCVIATPRFCKDMPDTSDQHGDAHAPSRCLPAFSGHRRGCKVALLPVQVSQGAPGLSTTVLRTSWTTCICIMTCLWLGNVIPCA